MGPRVHHILRTYWYISTMVAHAGSYYGESFQGFRGLTQGNLMYTTIFNVVVDAVVHHWVSWVAEEGAEMATESATMKT